MEETTIRMQAAALSRAARLREAEAPRQLIGRVLYAPDLAPGQLQQLSEAQAALQALCGKEDGDGAE